MQNKEGLFIVLEGVDGAGKSTQFKQLIERLQLAGHEVATVHFPRYDEPSSYFVKQYLNGSYGSAEAVGPYTASLFYALDRYEAANSIRQALREGKVVVADRFTGSNMAHQGTKFSNADERRGYFIWLDNLEFEMLHIPRPNLNLVLRVSADIAETQIDKHEKRDYTDKKRDVHEADSNHLRRTVEVFDDLCQLFPRDFVRVDCVRGGGMLPIETVSNLVWEKVSPFLPKPARAKRIAKAGTAPGASIATQNPYIEKTGAGKTATKMGEQYLRGIVTDPDGPVYGFTDKISATTIAAAMARLSRSRDDLRIMILDEFAQGLGEDEKLLRRVITAYGDDSVQQLVGAHLVVEGASNLLTKKLEWGRLAAYLEQSTRYVYFDQKDVDGNYKYYVPDNLDAETRRQYRSHMDKIFDLYGDMARRLTRHVRGNSTVPKAEQDSAWRSATRAQACDAIRPVLPVATKSTVGIFASGQALESLILHLQSDALAEARTAGAQLLEQGRKVIPNFLERADKPERGGAIIAYRANTAAALEKLAAQYLPDKHAGQAQQPADLIDVWPRNELDLAADMLYEYSDLPLRQLRHIVNSWPYDKKAAVLTTYMGERLNRRQRPGRALEKAHYAWDLISDYGVFRELQRHRMVDDLEWQTLTPRYGYDVPKLVDDAGLTDQFEACFDLSLKLYSILQQAGYALEAQYATLLGHKMRWKVMYNAREAFHLHELRTSPQAHSSARKLVRQMHEKIAEVHPLLASAMKFVNQDEDPELARLAAERYAQFKVAQLNQPTSDTNS